MAKERDHLRSGGRPLRPPQQILKDLRRLRVCVFHPRDRDGEELTRQLERIGCQVQAFWPPLPEPPAATDVVFAAVNPNMVRHDFAWCDREDAPSVIAVVAYENPTIIEMVLRIGAKAVVASPIRSFGILSALVLARELTNTLIKRHKRIMQLEAKLSGIRVVSEAQEILCRQRGITKEEAYRVIREQAMSKRVTAEEIAAAIINSNEILSFKA